MSLSFYLWSEFATLWHVTRRNEKYSKIFRAEYFLNKSVTKQWDKRTHLKKYLSKYFFLSILAVINGIRHFLSKWSSRRQLSRRTHDSFYSVRIWQNQFVIRFLNHNLQLLGVCLIYLSVFYVINVSCSMNLKPQKPNTSWRSRINSTKTYQSTKDWVKKLSRCECMLMKADCCTNAVGVTNSY